MRTSPIFFFFLRKRGANGRHEKRQLHMTFSWGGGPPPPPPPPPRQQKKSSENSTIPLSGAHRTVHLWQQHCTVTLAIYWFQLIEIAAMFAYNFFILEFGVPPLNSSHTPRLRNDDVKEPAAKYLDTNFGLVQ
jgi:hypothetical protein